MCSREICWNPTLQIVAHWVKALSKSRRGNLRFQWEIAGVVITTVGCRVCLGPQPLDGAGALTRVKYRKETTPFRPPQSCCLESLPSSFGDDHLGPDFVELHPEVLVLKTDLDVLVEASSRVWASIETCNSIVDISHLFDNMAGSLRWWFGGNWICWIVLTRLTETEPRWAKFWMRLGIWLGWNCRTASSRKVSADPPMSRRGSKTYKFWHVTHVCVRGGGGPLFKGHKSVSGGPKTIGWR